MARKEQQLYLLQPPYISPVAQKENMMSWSRLELVLEPTQRLQTKEEILTECHRQNKGSRNNIKNTDWPGAKQRKGTKT